MATEETRLRLRQKLEDAFGVEEAGYLMDRPPVGWSDLVTNPVLDAKLDALRGEIRTGLAEVRTELRGEIADLRTELTGEISGLRHEVGVGLATLSASVDERLRRQTWVSTSTLIAGLGLAFAIARFA